MSKKSSTFAGLYRILITKLLNYIFFMMKHFFTHVTLVGLFGLFMLFQGCDAGVDLNNIDTSVKVKANIATPIATVKATLGDFVGDGTWNIYVDNGLLTFKDTFSITRDFHKMDLSQYISSTTLNMNVYDKLEGLPFFVDGKITGTGVQIPLEFPLTLKLNGINHDEDYQRLDSALIRNASFVSNIAKTSDLPLKWEWIDKVTINMDPHFFYRQAGNVVTVYEKGAPGNYGEDMEINVDEFSINLMKNRNPHGFKEYWNNVVDSCQFTITMYITIPASAGVIHIPSTAAFQYGLDVQFIDYHAIWGMFQPSSDMAAQDEVKIEDAWGVWKDLRSVKLPFSDPTIDMQITTQIAGALRLTGDYLYVKDDTETPIYATFDGNKNLFKTFNRNEYLPLSSEIGESKTMHQLFDKDEQRGRIDQLFAVHPEKLGYKFSVDFDEVETPQIRITENTSIVVDAVCSLPFKFNEGTNFETTDTILGIDLSMLDMDSLLADVAVVDTVEKAHATLALTINNDIPFQAKGVFTCLDEDNNVIIDPKTNKPLLITQQDTVYIPSPEYTYNDLALNWIPTPVTHIETIQVDQDDLEILRKIKSILFYVKIDDTSLSDVFKEGNFTTKLTDNEGISVKIGIGADVEAVLTLFESNEQ